ncbi:hypothetical protein O181_025305 [Austropuccinia psidii MF-1]|uniref:O-methyltransferase C-terminal domain-containing protein n=1 Tax=Austropuccinia psidii MF-1 TaxID=1389203 RepID=A0A9Q3H103_9BASI|nr:hypothetical protein [Austropuccinia psidii MF-1]
MPSSQAQKLAALIAQAVDDIEADTARQIPGAVTTDINQPSVAPEDELEATPQRAKALRTLKAATHQLLATLLPAGMQVIETHLSTLQTAMLDIVVEAKIADLLYSLDPDSSRGGVHINVLSDKTGIDSDKLSHILRFLAVRNIFCEINENHWVNNRLSFPLRSDSKNSVLNYLGHSHDDIVIPALLELRNFVLQKKDSVIIDKECYPSAWSKHRKWKGDFFEHLLSSEGGYKAERFGKAMLEITSALGIGDSQYKGFDWKSLPPKGTLIDVGGGIGAASYALAGYLPAWKIIVQDRTEVVTHGNEHYQKIGSSANIEFEAHDFLKPQPVHRMQAVDAYFLRHILHDWPESQCLKILTLLRQAAKPSTYLLVCETKLDPPVMKRDSVILPNGGMATATPHNLDLTMMTLFDSKERNTKEYAELFQKGGWRFESAIPLMTTVDKYVFKAVPNSDWKDSSTTLQ